MKRSRKSAPKSRSGCRTCKLRHIKCDERQPDCSNCSSTGRKCDGYNVFVQPELPCFQHETPTNDVRMKRPRKSAPKSRSGCRTCKSRHVKCDEGRPTCSNCLDCNRTCEGYESFVWTDYSTPIQEERQLWPRPDEPPKPSARPMSESSSSEYQEDALTLTPSSGVTAPQKTPRSSDEWNSPSSMALSLHSSPLDESYERANNFLSNSPQALENFRGLLNSLFAKRSPSAICIINGLVGSCVFNPVLRLGLASLYELDQLRCSSRIEGDSPKFENARTQALKIYNSAIKKFAIHLKHGLVGFEDLMSCFIFICFEIIQGNYLAAFRHHQGCQGVIQRIKSLGCSTHSENTALVAFERISLHLENQATSYIGTKASNTGFGCSQSRISYPCFFTSLAEARHALDQQITDFLQFLIPHDYLGSDYCPPWTKYEGRSAGHFTVFHGSFKGYIPPDFATRRDQLLDALRAWKCCFGSSLQRQNDWSSDASPESISLIWISYWMTYIRVSTAHAVDENFYDAFLPTFELIITEAQHVLRDADPSSSESTDKKMRLGETIFGSGLVECLYFTCLKCREPGLRQKALTLLPRAGNDGIWEGELLAMVAEYVIQLETATPGDSNTIWSQDKFIDASRRVNGIALDIDKAHSRLWVRTVRNGSPCGDTRLSWEVEDAVLVLYHEKKS